MLCYKDETSCAYLECANIKYKRRLTENVKAAANKWWVAGGGDKEVTSIAVFFEKPTCFEENGNEH